MSKLNPVLVRYNEYLHNDAFIAEYVNTAMFPFSSGLEHSYVLFSF